MTTTTSAIDTTTHEAYVSQIQKLMVLSEGSRETDQEILEQVSELIRNQLKTQGSNEELASFVKAEEAFFEGQYKIALTHYLSGQTIPHYHFYCYRASAHLAKELGRTSKAIGFARKALKIYPNDYLTLKLLHELLVASGEAEDAQTVKQQIQQVSEAVTSGDAETATTTEEYATSHSVGLAEEEMNELQNLFAEETAEENQMYEERKGEESTADVDTTATMTLEEAKTETEVTSDVAVTSESTVNAIEQLSQLANSDYAVEKEATSRFLSESLGVDMESGETLEQRIKTFQRKQIETMSRYVEKSLRPSTQQDNFFSVLNGWNYTTTPESEAATLTHSLLPANYRKTTGGFFLRWNKKGIVINPGPNFLQNFHDQGHHIKEIDHVIVTRDSADSHADVQAIYDLNYGLNKMASELHIINYYLDQTAHRTIATKLKPHFKQERNTVHCLDLYVDSPDIETLQLEEGIQLSYFPTSIPEAGSRQEEQTTSIGVRLELTIPEILRLGSTSKDTVSVGYVTGAAYSPLLANNLSGADLLVTGFDATAEEDYTKMKYNDDSLGYFGTATLIEEVAPKLAIFTELSGSNGDIRLELTRKLRQEAAYGSQHDTVVLPGDTGLQVNLETQQVLCSISKAYVSPAQVRITKTADAFGPLQFLSPNSFI